MEISKKVEKVINEDKCGFLKDPAFIELRNFYAEMQKLGIATKQEYSLPNLDLVGKSLAMPSNPQGLQDL